MTYLKEIVTAAKAGIENLTPSEAAAEIDEGDVLLVDVREPAEAANGIIPTAVLAPRGVLEFQADATSGHHREWFVPSRRVIVYSAAGSRSALAAASLQHLGYRDVAHLDGGYRRWLDEGWPVLPPHPRLTGTASREGHTMQAHVELALPEDKRRSLLRVRLNDAWVGDLVFSSGDERDALVRALTAGDLSVVTRPIPLADLSIVEGT